MFGTTGEERRMQDLEAKVLGALDLYFEARRHEVEENKKALGPDSRRTKWCGGNS